MHERNRQSQRLHARHGDLQHPRRVRLQRHGGLLKGVGGTYFLEGDLRKGGVV